MHASSKAFTLIELLITIAIIAILAVVVVITINPFQLIAQSRDSRRISDMSTLFGTISFYKSDQLGAQFSLGSSSMVYVSLPDPNATTTVGSNCASLNLPNLPSPYSYHCAGPNYYRKTDGTGWIPINFQNISAGSPLGSLPVDPTNTSSSRLYYTYITNGSQFETTAAMESTKYKPGGSNDQITGDGGLLSTVYEKGTKLGLEPLDYRDYGDSSLVGYWPMDEGTGSSTIDGSGNGNAGTWVGNAIGTNGHYSAGHNQSWAGAFDGSSDIVNIPATSTVKLTGPMTMAAWVYPTISNAYQGLIVKGASARDYAMFLSISGTSYVYVSMGQTNVGNLPVSPGWSVNAWNFVVVTADGINVKVYINGVLANTTASTLLPTATSNPVSLGAPNSGSGGFYLHGFMDDVRIYNRALSAAEIQAIYNGGN